MQESDAVVDFERIRAAEQVAAMRAHAALMSRLSVLHVHDFSALDDVLVIDIDRPDLDRAYRCRWRGGAEPWEHDRLIIDFHWSSDCEESTAPLDPAETMELERWMAMSSAVREIRERCIGEAVAVFGE